MREDGRVLVWVLAFIAAAGLGFGALVGIGCAIGANECPFGDDGTEGAAMTGQQLWLANCALCHGPTGAGTPQNPAAPSLVTGPSSALGSTDLKAQIEDGSPGLMPRFEGKLTDAEIDRVTAYVLELREAS